MVSQQLFPLPTPLPLPCRTCASAAPGAPSSSPARPPSSRGLWPRSSCSWTGIEPCVAPTGTAVTSPLAHPTEVLGKGSMSTLVVQGSRSPSQICSPHPKLGGDFPFGVGPKGFPLLPTPPGRGHPPFLEVVGHTKRFCAEEHKEGPEHQTTASPRSHTKLSFPSQFPTQSIFQFVQRKTCLGRNRPALVRFQV